eukprot:14254946-Ditylum_brightwellii.AAC.1
MSQSSSAGVKAMGCGGAVRFGLGLLGSPVSKFCIDMCSIFVCCGTGFHTCVSGCHFVETHETCMAPPCIPEQEALARPPVVWVDEWAS